MCMCALARARMRACAVCVCALLRSRVTRQESECTHGAVSPHHAVCGRFDALEVFEREVADVKQLRLRLHGRSPRREVLRVGGVGGNGSTREGGRSEERGGAQRVKSTW